MTTQNTLKYKYYRLNWNNLKEKLPYNDLLSDFTNYTNNIIFGGAKKKPKEEDEDKEEKQ
jgi:hypothetical protein